MTTWTRRRFLGTAVAATAAVVGGGVGATELVSHGVLPGKQILDQLDGACSVPSPPTEFTTLGPSKSGTFFSRARRRTVGYTLAFPPDHHFGDTVPLVVMLHAFGGNHANALTGMTPQQAVALRVDGVPLAPMAMVTVDGGNGYWNPHPGDDPMSMVMDEVIPMCRAMGAGRPPHPVGVMGISMGGYGALLLGEKFPQTIRAVAAISPAVWTSYRQARDVNPGAYASAADFDACDVVTHARDLSGTPVRIASGVDDPFHPGVVALARALPPQAVVVISKGCHTGPFFTSQEAPSLQFLTRHLHAWPMRRR